LSMNARSHSQKKLNIVLLFIVIVIVMGLSDCGI